MTDWESHYLPAAECSPRIVRAAKIGNSVTGSMSVRVHPFGSTKSIPQINLSLEPLDSTANRTRTIATRDTTSSRVFGDIRPGLYRLTTVSFGYHRRIDTLAVRAAAADTIDLAVEDLEAGFRNEHNCHPRGFRRPGQPACVTDTGVVANARDHARWAMVVQARRAQSQPPDSTATPTVVTDERICERAARLYGEKGDPPRRVVVVAVARYFLVFDPYEPIPAGEWNIWTLFDDHWRLVIGLLG